MATAPEAIRIINALGLKSSEKLPATMIAVIIKYLISLLSATILVFASLVEVIVTSTLAQKEKLAMARKLDLWSRWLFPAIYLFQGSGSLSQDQFFDIPS